MSYSHKFLVGPNWNDTHLANPTRRHSQTAEAMVLRKRSAGGAIVTWDNAAEFEPDNASISNFEAIRLPTATLELRAG